MISRQGIGIYGIDISPRNIPVLPPTGLIFKTFDFQSAGMCLYI